MSDARRQRLRKAIVNDWARTHGIPRKQPLTSARMEELARLDHVESVEPMVFLWTKAAFEGKSERVNGGFRGQAGPSVPSQARRRQPAFRRQAPRGHRR